MIKQLDYKPNYERLRIIVEQLNKLNVEYRTQEYLTGTNLIVDLGRGNQRIGVSSHFDRVQHSGGANDNGSAIAVCLDIVEKYKDFQNTDLALRIIFFDEEENGLKGSTAYVKENGIEDLVGLINMELVGLGDKFALWPVTTHQSTPILEKFELTSNRNQIDSHRFDKIVTNTADHLPFRMAGLADSFTITCISDRDIQIAQKYFAAIAAGVVKNDLFEILSGAPIFEHYHRPTDTYDKLSEVAVVMTSSVIWETIIGIQTNS